MKTEKTHFPVPQILRAASILCLIATVATWFALGAHLGWTKTSVATQKIDEITGIEYPVFENRFVPGVEFLAAGIGLSFALAVVAFLPIFPKSQP
ncbi:MAG: hypothetical protein ACOYNN_01535 [Terrimicrobiaceae bacterium]|jgi:hypothetical protein